MKSAGALLFVIGFLFFVEYAVYPSQTIVNMNEVKSYSDAYRLIGIIAIVQVLLLIIAGILLVIESNKINRFIENTSTYIDDLYSRIESNNSNTI